MARSCDLQLEDNITSVSCKDLGHLRYHMVSAFIAIVQMLHALHSLWVSLLPFLMLWWNLMLCVTCAKYFSWNRSRLRLPIAGRRLYGNSTPEADSFVEASNAEESLISSHQRGSCADTWHAEKREMSILSLSPRESCAEALPRQGPHFMSLSKPFLIKEGCTWWIDNKEDSLCKMILSVCTQAFPYQRGTHKHDANVDVAAHCTDESDAHLLDQLEQLVSCETTSIDSPAEATASYISKLSSLSFLDGRGPHKSRLLKASHWAACSSLLPPLLDICHPLNPQKYSWLQLNLLRNGDMLHFKVPMLINDFSINWSILGQWLQIHNGCSVSCVLVLIRGKDVDYATFQLVLPTIGGIDITRIISLAIVAFKWTMEDVESTISESSDLSIHELRSSVAYVGLTCHDGNENSDDGCHRVYGIDDQHNYERDYSLKNEDENNGSDNCEDLGSTSLQSEDGCDVVYGIDVRAIYDRDDGADVIHCRQCDGHEVFCHYNRYHDVEDSGFDSGEDSGDVYGSFVHSNDEVDGCHDRSFRCDVGDDGPRNVEDVDGSCDRQHYDAGDGFYNSDRDFDDDVEDNGDVFSDFDFVDDNGLYGKPLEMKDLHVAYTWWDEDAVLLDRQEGEEETMEQDWQLV